jgi:hypothetical protein
MSNLPTVGIGVRLKRLANSSLAMQSPLIVLRTVGLVEAAPGVHPAKARPRSMVAAYGRTHHHQKRLGPSARTGSALDPQSPPRLLKTAANLIYFASRKRPRERARLGGHMRKAMRVRGSANISHPQNPQFMRLFSSS